MSIADYNAIFSDRRRRLAELCAETCTDPEPFILEIGSGHGHFLTAYAEAHPDRRCVGIDLLADRVARADRKRDQAGLSNLRFLRANAEDFLAVLPAQARFRDIYLLFPDPWPKRRHHKNRLIQAGFLERLAGRAEQGSRLYFRTDHEPYFTQARRAIGAIPLWREIEAPWPFEVPTVFQQRAARYFSLVASREMERALPGPLVGRSTVWPKRDAEGA